MKKIQLFLQINDFFREISDELLKSSLKPTFFS